ncbi:MAG: molybdopterin synthase sulfur carrier subunit [Natronomonas sp.]|jgi:molybdopterin synthase sulfur carrier subunit
MTDADQQSGMELELRFFATFREAVGQKTLNWDVDDDATIGDVLLAIEEEYPELVRELLDEEGDIQPQLTVLKNGREVVHLEGTETELEDGDRVSVFPPVAGG